VDTRHRRAGGLSLAINIEALLVFGNRAPQILGLDISFSFPCVFGLDNLNLTCLRKAMASV
jgi:hypothetical protein